eukprot:jgi/Chlat1/6590/Chrsp46S06087
MMYGCCCTACAYGDNADKVRGGGCCGPCCLYMIFPCCAILCCAPQVRAELRGKFGLQPEPCGDCCVHFFCSACAVCQEGRELKNRGVVNFQPQNVVVMAAPQTMIMAAQPQNYPPPH